VYSVTSCACSFNQPVLFVPIIMQIDCHSGAMRGQQCRRSFECNRLTECKSHGLWLLFLVLLMFLLLIHLVLIFFSVFCPHFSRAFLLIFPYIFFLLCFCISPFPLFWYLFLSLPFLILCYSSFFFFCFCRLHKYTGNGNPVTGPGGPIGWVEL
jgi:hypothetical protein